jgi:hypothetical protein
MSEDPSHYDADPFIADDNAELLRIARIERNAWRRASCYALIAGSCAVIGALLSVWGSPPEWQAYSALVCLIWIAITGMQIAVPMWLCSHVRMARYHASVNEEVQP